MKRPVGNAMRPGLVLVFLTLLNVLSFSDRFLMQAFAVDMSADLHLTNLQFTLLTGFVFTGFYTCLGLVMGALADRWHRPRLMAAGIVVWSALTSATALASNFVQIALCRLFVGVGEATLTPAALGLLGDVFSRARRASVSGFYYLGAPVGIGMAFIIAGTLGAQVGWRNCFIILGAVGLVLSGLLLLLREPRSAPVPTQASARRPVANVFAEVRVCLSDSPVLCLTIVGGVLVIFAQGALVLDQLWLVQERGLSKQYAQNISGLLFVLGGVIGAIFGGFASDFMHARRAGGRLYFLALVYLIGVPVGYLFRFADPAGILFYPCMFVGSVMITIGYGPLFAIVQDLVPDGLRSTMTAFLILCMTLLGTSPGNLLVGWLADLFRSQALAEPITMAVLVGLTPWLLAIPCFVVAARMMERQHLVAAASLAPSIG